MTNALRPHERTIARDQEWPDGESVTDAVLSDYVFERVSAKNVRFVNVNFKYGVFDDCYFRNCTFESCDFTGCRFVGSNFHNSSFIGCKFEYAAFERTLISDEILDTCCPSWQNVKQRFARTLRVNYQSLGDSGGANKAVLVELDATRIHLSNAWRGNESYYRQKYRGVARIKAFLKWIGFVVSDFVWGNGERPAHLIRTTIALLLAIAVLDVALAQDVQGETHLFSALESATSVFLGTQRADYPALITAFIALSRYVILGLFVSILVRRFARR